MNFQTTLFMVDRLAFGRICLLLCCFLGISWGVLAQSNNPVFPDKPEPAIYVNDYSGWLQAGEKNALEQKLRAYWDSTTTQIVVMIRPDIGDYDKAGYAFELGNRWGIGRSDKNNGVVVLIKTEAPERGVFIATGYGTEGALPDITAGRIIRNTMAPYFRNERYYEGIDAGLDNIIQALEGEYRKEPAKKLSTWQAILIVLIIAVVFFSVVGAMAYGMRNAAGKMLTHDGRRRRKGKDDDFFGGGGGWWIGGGGNSGGGWGGGGGFGGGSFGGGSFGGGGAGGDW